MPRINVEERWWSDPRRMLLSAKLGVGTADGVWLNAVRIAQNSMGEPFDPDGLLLPEWIDALVSCGLADRIEEKIYVKGSAEHHKWIKSQRERAKLGGLARQRKISELQIANAKQTLSQNQLNAMPSSSSSCSSSNNSFSSNEFKQTLSQTQANAKQTLEVATASQTQENFMTLGAEIKILLSQAFGGKVPIRVTRRISKFSAYWPTKDEFADALEGCMVSAENEFRKQHGRRPAEADRSSTEWRRYLQNFLLGMARNP